MSNNLEDIIFSENANIRWGHHGQLSGGGDGDAVGDVADDLQLQYQIL